MNSHIDPLDGISVFAAVVEAESFSGAARTLRRSKAAVSTQIQRLEDRLNVRLLNRTTRKLSLTDEGRVFYEHARRILDEASEAHDAIDNLDVEPRGTLRLNAPMSFGKLHLGTAIADFLSIHPDINVDLDLNDRQIDVVEEGYDMAIRIASLPDSSLIARRLAPCRRVIVASPDYWDRNGRPEHPGDLSRHESLLYSYLTGREKITFEDNGKQISVPVSGRYRANNGEVLLDAALRGLGVYLCPTFFCCDQMMDGALEPVLLDFEIEPISVYAVYPHRRHLTTRVRTFVDFLVGRFGEAPYWDAWRNARPV